MLQKRAQNSHFHGKPYQVFSGYPFWRTPPAAPSGPPTYSRDEDQKSRRGRRPGQRRYSNTVRTLTTGCPTKENEDAIPMGDSCSRGARVRIGQGSGPKERPRNRSKGMGRSSRQGPEELEPSLHSPQEQAQGEISLERDRGWQDADLRWH